MQKFVPDIFVYTLVSTFEGDFKRSNLASCFGLLRVSLCLPEEGRMEGKTLRGGKRVTSREVWEWKDGWGNFQED